MSVFRDNVPRVGGGESSRIEVVSVGYYKSRLGSRVTRGVLLRDFCVVCVRVWCRGFASFWCLHRGSSVGSRVEVEVSEEC